MISLGEWKFLLTLRPCASPASLNELSNGLMDDAVEWAEAKHLGIGGGYRIAAVASGPESAFRFGLCATRDEQLISEAEADELLRHLQCCAAAQGAELGGTWRPFTESEISGELNLNDDDE